jgi:hypothetical protein
VANLDQPAAKDTILGVLGYIDSPFKLGVVILLAVLTFGGYIFYENQSFVFSAISRNAKIPKADVSKMDDAAAILFKEAAPEAIAFFEVDQMLNTRVLVRAYTKEGRFKGLDGIDVGMWSNSSANNNDLAELVSGKQPCGDYLRAQSMIGLWYLQQGNFACRSSAPSDVSAFAAQITVIYKGQPKDLEKVRDVMTLAAAMITKK